MIEPAALRWGRGLTALDAHEVELWIDGRFASHPALEARAALAGTTVEPER